jgi:hypothetical protein
MEELYNMTRSCTKVIIQGEKYSSCFLTNHFTCHSEMSHKNHLQTIHLIFLQIHFTCHFRLCHEH